MQQPTKIQDSLPIRSSLPEAQRKYPTTPLWGGQERRDTVPSFIYDTTLEPLDRDDAIAKISVLRQQIEDIELQLSRDYCEDILEDRFGGHEQKWQKWQTDTRSCLRIKKAQKFLYHDWISKNRRVEPLASAPITEALRIAQKALTKVNALEKEVNKLQVRCQELENAVTKFLIN
jgi:7-keto-8-aminopelargonate synthetase-like enzyme